MHVFKIFEADLVCSSLIFSGFFIGVKVKRRDEKVKLKTKTLKNLDALLVSMYLCRIFFLSLFKMVYFV
jgi:uncharacterized membrane protein YciS (DUF1049 family)